MPSTRNDSAADAGKNTGRGRRPGGLAIGDTYAFPDGLMVRVSRLGLLPSLPQKTIFDDDPYLDSEAVRFEVTVTNDSDKPVKLGELTTGLRSGPEGRPGDESWSGTVLPDLYTDAKTGKERLTQEQREELFAEAMRELDAMTGLAPVKRRVRLLAARARMSALRARHGLPDAGAANHLVFCGPPGTGKTTVAVRFEEKDRVFLSWAMATATRASSLTPTRSSWTGPGTATP